MRHVQCVPPDSSWLQRTDALNLLVNTTLALIPLHDLGSVDTGDDLSTEAAYASLVPTALALISACDHAILHELTVLPDKIASENNDRRALLSSLRQAEQQIEHRFPRALTFAQGRNLLTGQKRNDRGMPILEEILRKDYESNPRYPSKPLPTSTAPGQPHDAKLFIASELEQYKTHGFQPFALNHLLQFAPDDVRKAFN